MRYEVKSLRKFCLERHLSWAHLAAVADGKRVQHKGWKCARASEDFIAAIVPPTKGRIQSQKTIAKRIAKTMSYGHVTDPTGKPYLFSNMAQFCRTYVLSISVMSQMLRGLRNHHKGWTGTRITKEEYERLKALETTDQLDTPRPVKIL